METPLALLFAALACVFVSLYVGRKLSPYRGARSRTSGPRFVVTLVLAGLGLILAILAVFGWFRVLLG